MQINNNVQYSRPAFGMALRIDKGAEKFLTEQTNETLRKLGELGKEFKNYKYWHLDVNDKGYEIVENKSFGRCYKGSVGFPASYQVPLANEVELGAYYSRYAQAGQPAKIRIRDLDQGEPQKIVDKFKKLDSLGRFAETVRMLEIESYKKAVNKAVADAIKTEKKELAQSLMSEFPREIQR